MITVTLQGKEYLVMSGNVVECSYVSVQGHVGDGSIILRHGS
jgi:hypothetical protein